jgi:hypothetical protein
VLDQWGYEPGAFIVMAISPVPSSARLAKIILMVLSFASPLMQDLDVTMANGHETHSSTVVKQQMNTIEDNLKKITWDI